MGSELACRDLSGRRRQYVRIDDAELLGSTTQKLCGLAALNEAKVGDLLGIRVHKFRLSNQLCMLAYRILDKDSLKLLVFGPHENFYRDLKRHEK